MNFKAILSVDPETIRDAAGIDDDIGNLLEKEMGWVDESGIRLIDYEETEGASVSDPVEALKTLEAFCESNKSGTPIGRIDYHSGAGIRESIDFFDEEAFKDAVSESNYSGEPISIALYKTGDADHIGDAFIREMDPPALGYKVEKVPDRRDACRQMDCIFASRQSCPGCFAKR